MYLCAAEVRSFKKDNETKFSANVTCGNIITLSQILSVKRI